MALDLIHRVERTWEISACPSRMIYIRNPSPGRRTEKRFCASQKQLNEIMSQI